MSTPASHNRPLALRLRHDLVFAEVRAGGAPTWTVKDPLTLEHHHFTAEEHFLLERLRRPASLSDLRRAYERRFAPQRITHDAIWKFLNHCHASGLVVSTAPGQAATLRERARKERNQKLSTAWMQLLAIRFPGVDPNRFLSAVHRRCGWLFSWWTAAAAALVVLFAGSLVVGRFDEFCARLPALSALADPRNLLWMMVALSIIKILHELGHALACKHFGGDVHELGLMLLAFTPCLYCDVSDAWQMPNRRHRILISAAGILVELVLAAVAVIVWWASEPGIINLLALNIVLVSTVSTLLINGNPLLRYDGYYILSDLTETPNLWQRSRQVWGDLTKRWFMKRHVASDPITPTAHYGWLAVYALASKVYLTLVLVGIVWMLVQFLYPLHLQNLAYGLGAMVVASTLVGPVNGASRMLRNPLRRREVRGGRVALVVLGALVLLVALAQLSVPYHVTAPLVLLPRDAHRVYASVDGTLVRTTARGTKVDAGEEIARLANSDIRRELLQLEGQRQLHELKLANLQALRAHDDSASAEIPATRAALESIDQQLADRRRDAERLRITSPVAGTVIPVPAVLKPREPTGRLEFWTGSLLDEENRGAGVTAGTLVCWVGDPERFEAVVLVDDAEAPRIAPRQRVRLELDSLPAEVVRGEVIEVSRRDAATAHLEGTADEPLERLAVGMFPPGREATRYHVTVSFDAPDTPLLTGTRGTAKIVTEPMTLGRRAVRWLAQTFRVW